MKAIFFLKSKKSLKLIDLKEIFNEFGVEKGICTKCINCSVSKCICTAVSILFIYYFVHTGIKHSINSYNSVLLAIRPINILFILSSERKIMKKLK